MADRRVGFGVRRWRVRCPRCWSFKPITHDQAPHLVESIRIDSWKSTSTPVQDPGSARLTFGDTGCFGRRPKTPTYPQRPVDCSWRRSVRVSDITICGPITTHESVTTVRGWDAVRRSCTSRRFKTQSSPRGNTAACGRALGRRPKQRSHERRPQHARQACSLADVRAQVPCSDW